MRRIVSIDVGLEMQTAVLVDPGCEIDQVHRNRFVEPDVFLNPGVHRLPYALVVPLRGAAQDIPRERLRLFETDATVTERAGDA